GGLQCAKKPWDGLIHLTLLQKISADIVVWIAKRWIDFNGTLAFGHGIVQTPHETVSPAAKRVSLGSGVALDRLGVELDCGIQLPFHLLAMRFFEKACSEFFASVFVHGIRMNSGNFQIANETQGQL